MKNDKVKRKLFEVTTYYADSDATVFEILTTWQLLKKISFINQSYIKNVTMTIHKKKTPALPSAFIE